MEVYAFAGEDVKTDPRRCDAYRDQVVQGVGLGVPEKWAHLSKPDHQALTHWVRRKAGAFWVKDSPRTTVRGILHDCLTRGPPVRGPPIRLKGADLQDVEDGILKDLERGQLVRGNSPWGSWAFPVRATGKKVRIVVDYRRVNGSVIRAVYYLRRADDCKSEVLGSVFISLLDAVSGFNQIRNTERAKRVLAVLASSGCYLPNALTMGGHNGPDDFSFAVDTLFSLGPNQARRLNKQWQVYVDDFCARTGRWR